MPRMTVPKLLKLKGQRKIVMLTAYDAPSARLVDEVAEMALVGDSVATTVQGRRDTLGVTMQEMLYHTRLVAENTQKSMVVGDMPFMSYQTSISDAVHNAGRFLKEGMANAVKLEGGARVAAQVTAIVRTGIPVVGHLGYTPQSVNTTGVAVNRDRNTLIEDAKALQDAGVFALVLEMVPSEISTEISSQLTIPTIGIGGGSGCDGQVLVFHDVLGFNPDFTPKFLKRYMDFHGLASEALKKYREEVLDGSFPDDSRSYE